eukprot:TRINITY_DN3187_c0_g1_i1.p1 TRINITY_DN3187_c0_g1~~TRINITY_DN3187_c0_g1_i1.p1  ORF type:complete len:787 (+),score=251.30 TRINITY_DN3187_c0_g1_i1:2238-4598(+)
MSTTDLYNRAFYGWNELNYCENNFETYPTPRYGHSITYLSNVIILFGGVEELVTGQKKLLSDLWLFDIKKGRWYEIDEQGPGARYYHGAACIDGLLYIFGGTSFTTSLNDLWMFDIKTRRWTLYQPKYSPAARHSCTFTNFGNKLIMFGGTNDEKCFGDFWMFDTVSTDSSWLRLSPGGTVDDPVPRYGHVCFVLGSDIIIHGGSDSKHILNDVWCFNAISLGWTRLSISAHAPHLMRHACVAIGRSNALIIGGTQPNKLGIFSRVFLLQYKLNSVSENVFSTPARNQPDEIACEFVELQIPCSNSQGVIPPIHSTAISFIPSFDLTTRKQIAEGNLIVLYGGMNNTQKSVGNFYTIPLEQIPLNSSDIESKIEVFESHEDEVSIKLAKAFNLFFRGEGTLDDVGKALIDVSSHQLNTAIEKMDEVRESYEKNQKQSEIVQLRFHGYIETMERNMAEIKKVYEELQENQKNTALENEERRLEIVKMNEQAEENLKMITDVNQGISQKFVTFEHTFDQINDNMNQNKGEFNTKMNEMDEKFVELLLRQKDDSNEEISKLQTKFRSIEERNQDNSEKIEELKEMDTELKNKFDESIERVNESIESCNVNFDVAIKDAISQLTLKYQEELQKRDERIEKLSNENNTLFDKIEQQNDLISSLINRVEFIENLSQAHDDRMSSLTQIEGFTKSQLKTNEDMTQKVSSICDEIDDLKKFANENTSNELNQIKSDINAMLQRISVLQDDFGSRNRQINKRVEEFEQLIDLRFEKICIFEGNTVQQIEKEAQKQ